MSRYGWFWSSYRGIPSLGSDSFSLISLTSSLGMASGVSDFGQVLSRKRYSGVGVVGNIKMVSD